LPTTIKSPDDMPPADAVTVTTTSPGDAAGEVH
jgi:hypothetical protein